MTEQEIREELQRDIWWFDFPNFYNLVAYHESFTKFIELGVWKGNSIAYLANLLRNRKDLEIYGVDTFENSNYIGHTLVKNETVLNLYEIYDYNLKRNNVRHLIKDIKGCSWEAAKQFPDEYFDFILIDADHCYQPVKNDILNWFPKIKKSGVFAGHDWECASIAKAVREIFKDGTYTISHSCYPGEQRPKECQLNSIWYFDFTTIDKNKVKK